ncbi:MAG: electron transfer flavoprotein subunit alpha/FixB family protein [Bacteroidetes bacterium]|nr:electron transfer flavoprotein subunit alpha/FixB family protein [Bacteroidota bacterium]
MSILVYNENWDGKFKKLSFELVSYAYGIAQQAGTEVIALSIGDVEEEELKSLASYGASKIISVNNAKLKFLANKAYAGIIAEVAGKEVADIIVMAHNNTGKAISPRLSVKLKAGLATTVNALPESLSPFVVSKKVYTGKAYAKLKINSEKKILTLAQNSFGIIENSVDAKIEAFDAAVNDADIQFEVRDVNKVTGKVLLNDAEIVVSGGRGMKGPENWGPIEELADTLGGATACSRPVSDEGWRPHAEHTGQTGKIIAPNLYFALGISGAIQHVAGVSSSKVIVAVNKDPEAPIFEVADYGIVGDVMKVLPELISSVKKIKTE